MNRRRPLAFTTPEENPMQRCPSSLLIRALLLTGAIGLGGCRESAPDDLIVAGLTTEAEVQRVIDQ